MSRMIIAATTLLTFAALAALAGCNTMEGAGQDLQAAGEAIEDAADDE